MRTSARSRALVLLVLIGVLASLSPATAQHRKGHKPRTNCVVGEFLAEYFNNTTFDGSTAFARCESGIDHDWGAGSPVGVDPETFSTRWTGAFDLSAGDYVFSVTADDG